MGVHAHLPLWLEVCARTYTKYTNTMGQKVHPFGFRLGITQEYKSNWFAKPCKKGEFSQLIAEDSAIRTTLFQQLTQFGLTDVNINRHADFLQVVLYVSKPRVFTQAQEQAYDHRNALSTGDTSSASIAHHIVYTLRYIYKRSLIRNLTYGEDKHIDHSKLSVIIKRCDSYSAHAIAQQIREDLQKRTPFRRCLKQALTTIKQSNTKGAKIQIAGRLNGSEIARTEWTREGQLPLHTLRAKIDFCYVPAFTAYGVLGIKVWVYTRNEA